MAGGCRRGIRSGVASCGLWDVGGVGLGDDVCGTGPRMLWDGRSEAAQEPSPAWYASGSFCCVGRLCCGYSYPRYELCPSTPRPLASNFTSISAFQSLHNPPAHLMPCSPPFRPRSSSAHPVT